jgi:multidrug efflux pump subunit AcrB
MWLIKASVRNPYMVAALVFMILVLGLVVIQRVPVDILPVFKAPAVQVLTYYPGMPATSIEKTITTRIERWVVQAPGAERLESKSVPGVSVIKAYFREGVDPNGALTLSNSLALGTLPTLPPNTLPPVVLPFDPTGTLPLGLLTVKNDFLDEAHVKDVARVDVRNMLGAVSGSVAPVVVGGKDRTIMVYLKPDQMEARGLAALDVIEALRHGNLMTTPGTLYMGKDQILLDSNSMAPDVNAFKKFPIVTKQGQVYLEDVANVEDGASIQTSRVRIDGKPQVYVPIYRQGGASSLAVSNDVQQQLPVMEDKLARIAKATGLAGKTKLGFVMDQAVYVREAIESLIHEGVIGAILVAIMILIFLGNWRMTVIATISIPVSILGAIIGIYVTGNTINVMTLGGLALAIGPLVDDAIVALENTHRNYSLGKSRVRAALDGAIEVMVPVMVATCTTCIVLAPLALMPGMGGFLFRPLALAVAFAMWTSFVLSRSFVPMMCAKFLPEEHGRGGDPRPGREHPDRGLFGRMHHHIEAFLERTTRRYSRLLEWSLAHRPLVLTVVGLLFAGSMGLGLLIGREFFPEVDAGQITMYVRCPSRYRLDTTEQHIAEVEEFIKANIPADEREMIVSEMGLDPDWSAAYSANSGQQDTVIRVQLNENRTQSAQEYAIKLRHNWASDPRCQYTIEGGTKKPLEVSFDTGGMVSTALNFGANSPMEIQVEGGNQQDAFTLAEEIRDRVAKVRGAADAHVVQRLDAPYMVIEVDRAGADLVGLTTYDVMMQVVAAINSSVSIDRNFWIDNKTGNQYFVAVQYPEDPHRTLDDLLNIPARTASHDEVRLSSLVHLHPSTGAVEVNHVALYRIFSVQVNTENRDLAGVAGDVDKSIADIRKAASSRGMHVDFKGQYQQMNDSFQKLLGGLAGAALLVYLLQVALFRSFAGPFVIMFTVPLGLIGVLTILFLTHTTLNVQSEMGVIFLVGIAVNNGVLMVDFANQQRKLGASVPKAIRTAASIRFRPIIMTFLATFLDLIPMAIGLGRGSEANIPLARAVVGGLLTSTALTLFVLPIMYTLLIRDKPFQELDLDAILSDESWRDGPRRSDGGAHAS